MPTRYLNYLHADIRQAMRNLESLAPVLSGPEFWLNEIRNLLIDEPRTTFGERCGLTAEAFPPARLLRTGQMERLCTALHALYRSWRLDLLLPECVPAKAAYPALVSVLDKKLPIAASGWVVVDFCESKAACPFGQDCFCRQGEQPCPTADHEPDRDDWY